jgi:chaperonin GroES
MTITLKPLLNRVVLERLKEKTGGLILAPAGQKSAHRAKVIAVGPGMLDRQNGEHIPVDLKPGDIVLINPFLGLTSEVDGQEIVIQKEEEILTKVIGGEFDDE